MQKKKKIIVHTTDHILNNARKQQTVASETDEINTEAPSLKLKNIK